MVLNGLIPRGSEIPMTIPFALLLAFLTTVVVYLALSYFTNNDLD